MPENNLKIDSYKHLITATMVLTIVAVSFLTYKDILHYFFTGRDTFTLIESSRIQSMSDIVRIMNEPLNSASRFSIGILFYRPITSFSYSLDYYFWGLNPFGYQLTNLILHCIVSVLVFYFTILLTDGKKITAYLSSLFFTLHPILQANLHSIADRQDIILSIFILLALLFFLKQLTSKNKKLFMFLSVFFYLFALGAKEVGIILPPLIFILLLTCHFSEKISMKSKMVKSMVLSLPYFLITFIYIVWRTYVLRGIGGYGYSLNKKEALFITKAYFMSLVNPYNLSGNIFNSIAESFGKIDYKIILLIFFLLFLLNIHIVARVVKDANGHLMKTYRIILIIAMTFSFIGMLVYPFVSLNINHLIHEVYNGENVSLLRGLMGNINNVPVELYVNKGQLLYKIFLIMLFLCSLFLVRTNTNDMKSFICSESGKLKIFLLSWMLLPFCIFIFVKFFSIWYMYPTIIPFSIFLSFIFVENIQSLFRGKQRNIMPRYFARIISAVPEIIKLAVLSGFIFVLLNHSPLLRYESTPKSEEPLANIRQTYLMKLLEISSLFPKNGVINLCNVPSYIHVMEIESWINLNHPQSNMKIIILSQLKPDLFLKKYELKIIKEDKENATIDVLFYNEHRLSLK